MSGLTAAEVAQIRAEAAARGYEAWVDTVASQAYVTEVSVPSFGDGGIQRLHSPVKEPEPEPEVQL